MCGIIGVISFEKQKHILSRRDVLSQAFITGTLRGIHSTGLFAVEAEKKEPGYNNLSIYKKDVAGYDFIQLKQTDRLLTNINNYKYFIGHHRHATYGTINSKNAHPFVYDNITLVHNGSLTNLHALTTEYSKFEVDSEALTYALATKGYKEVIKKIKGAAALVWYDSNEDALFMYRNKDRPLFFAKIKDADISFIASEMWMLKGLIWRNGLEVEEIYDVGEDQVISFKNKALPDNTEIIKPEEVVPAYNGYKYASDERVTQGIFKKGKQKPTTIDPAVVLEQFNLKIGDIIHFVIDEIETPSKNSKHGEAKGIRTVEPYPDVSCYGVDLRKFKPKDIVKAEVVGVKMADHRLGACIVTKNPKKAGESKHPNLLLLPNVKEEIENGLIKGPNGNLITAEEFKKLTESGCDNCTGVISTIFAEKIIWTNEKKPICHVCSEKLTTSGFMHH